MRCDCKRNDYVLKLCLCEQQQPNAQAGSYTQTISPARKSNVFSDCCSLQCVIASRSCEKVVQGESAKRRPESIQHFLFLVSVFLFGERDLYCRARYFNREKRCPSQVYKTKKKNTSRKIRPLLISDLSRGKVFWKSC